MPAQRTKAVVPPASRSAFAQVAGVPSWAAVLIAVTATLVGFAFEAGSGSQELGTAFALSYAVGCVIAALAVRASGIFTAVIQPPLLLFVAVPLSYFLLHRSAFTGLKDLLITCGYPLVERFPLMLFTTAAVLLVGLIRWYAAAGVADSQADGADREDLSDREDAVRTSGPGLLAGVVGRLAALVRPAGEMEAESAAPGRRPRHGIDRSARASRPGRDGRRRREGSERTTPPRARHARPTHAEEDGPPLGRREGRRGGRRGGSREGRREFLGEDRWEDRRPGRAAHAADGPPRRSRPRPSQRGPYEAPPDRNGRRGEYRDEYHQPREPRFPPRRQPGAGRPDYPGYYEPPPPYPPRNPPPYPPRYRPRPEPPMDGRRGDGTHHPVSRVRYRGEPAQPPDRPDWSERRQPGRPRRDAGR